MKRIFISFVLCVLFMFWVPFSLADNQLSDTFLQPAVVAEHPSSWSLGVRYGWREGSGELSNDGFRLDIPRITGQKNVADQILFRASFPFVYRRSLEQTVFTGGDPSFFTTLQVSAASTLTVGINEPAANRPLEPDVVRFMLFYTHRFEKGNFYLDLQVGPEIPDRYFGLGQDDVLNYGLALGVYSFPLRVDFISKNVVTGKWFDLSNRIEHPLNRYNITVSSDWALTDSTVEQLQLFVGVQQASELQFIAGGLVRL